jgi:hypothetical protein
MSIGNILFVPRAPKTDQQRSGNPTTTESAAANHSDSATVPKESPSQEPALGKPQIPGAATAPQVQRIPDPAPSSTAVKGGKRVYAFIRYLLNERYIGLFLCSIDVEP